MVHLRAPLAHITAYDETIFFPLLLHLLHSSERGSESIKSCLPTRQPTARVIQTINMYSIVPHETNVNRFRRCFCEGAQRIAGDGGSISNLTGRRARTSSPRTIRSVLSGLGSH